MTMTQTLRSDKNFDEMWEPLRPCLKDIVFRHVLFEASLKLGEKWSSEIFLAPTDRPPSSSAQLLGNKDFSPNDIALNEEE